ncbi:MAG: hypothetical protein ACHRHE_05075, partial [Tepidisphaerales bacterium]
MHIRNSELGGPIAWCKMARLLSALLCLGAMSGMMLGCQQSPAPASTEHFSRLKDLPPESSAQPDARATQTNAPAPPGRPAKAKPIVVAGWAGVDGRIVSKSDSVAEELLASQSKIEEVEVVSFELHEVTDDDVTAMLSLPNLRQVAICGSHTTDASVERISRLTSLRAVSFYGTKITDAGLEHLKALKKLEKLSVTCDRKSISDTGLANLAELTELRELRLLGGMIGDDGLTFLENLDKLRSLDLFGERVTDAGLAHLRRLGALKDLSLR